MLRHAWTPEFPALLYLEEMYVGLAWLMVVTTFSGPNMIIAAAKGLLYQTILIRSAITKSLNKRGTSKFCCSMFELGQTVYFGPQFTYER